MPRIGNITLRATLFLFVVALFWAAPVAAQLNVTATVSETNPYKGERIILTIEVSGDNFRSIELPKLPQLTGLQYLSTSPNTSQSFTVVNGRTSRKYSYSYYLQTLELGDFTIPGISISIDGTELVTEPINVKVLDRSTAASRETADSMTDIFLRIEVSERNPYVNQQIQANIVLYFKQTTDVLSYQPNPSWKAEGFWKEDLEDGVEARTESIVMNGVRYRKATLMQYALFPSKSGRLTISPYQVTFNIRIPPSANQPFSGWGGFGSSQRTIDLLSDPVVINVKDLPAGSVGSSLGAVGQFEIKRRVSNSNIVVGETVELLTDISGVGNIALVSSPEYEFPTEFETYDPQIQTDVNRKGTRINGSKLVKDILIARRAGTYTIPETTVSWYNDRSGSWQSQRLAAITINVAKDPNAVSVSAPSTFNGTQVMTGLAVWTTADNTSIIGNTWFWFGLFSPFLVFGVGFLFMRYTNRMQTDVAFARSRKAAAKSESCFNEARSSAANGDIKAGYGNIHKALSGFIGDRLNLPPAGLSDQMYKDELLKAGVPPTIANSVHDLLTTCSTIRYAPNTDQATFEADLKSARDLLGHLRKSL